MKQLGFSLVEVLVAMTILSMMTFLAASSFAMFGDKWNGRLGKFDRTFEQTRTKLTIDETLHNVIPYVVQNINGEPRFYFEGNINGFVAVAQRGVQYTEAPALIRFSVQQQDNFRYSLMYEEWPMQDRILEKSGVTLEFDPPIIIAQDIEDIEFEYFGAPVPDKSLTDANGANRPIWLNEYNSFQTFFHPQKIRVTTLNNDVVTPYVINLIQPTGANTSIISLIKNYEEYTDY